MTGRVQALLGPRIRLSTSLAPELENIAADPDELEQAVLSLALHAHDGGLSDGEGTLSLSTLPVTLDRHSAAEHAGVEPGRYVLLLVSYPGPALDAAGRERLFEPSFSTKQGGDGLGLASVYAIVKRSGGHIGVASSPGQGTTLSLYFPCREYEEGADNRQPG